MKANNKLWKKEVISQFNESWHNEINDLENWLNYTHERRRLMISSLIGNLKENDLVLDIGSADGNILCHLIRKKKLLGVGIDFSQKLVKLANDSIKKNEITNEILLIADAEYLPFFRNSFNTVYCLATIEHLPNPELAIQEMARVVKPGEKIIIITPNPLHGMLEKIFAKFRHQTVTKRRLTNSFFKNNVEVLFFFGFILLLPFKSRLLEKTEQKIFNYSLKNQNSILTSFFLHLMVNHFIVGIKKSPKQL